MWPELFNYAVNTQLRALIVLEEQAAAAAVADHGVDHAQCVVFAGCCHRAFLGPHDLRHPHYCPSCFPDVRSAGCDAIFYVPAYPPLGGMLIL